MNSWRKVTLLLTLFISSLLLSASASANDAWLGVYTQTVDKDLKEAFDLDAEKGVIIKNVVPNSPADEAGLRQGDVILTIDKISLADADQLTQIIQGHQSGDEIDMTVSRRGKEKQVAITLGEKDDSDRAIILDNNIWSPRAYSKSHQYYREAMTNTYIGVTLESLNKQLGEYFGVKDGNGVLISEIQKDSPAEKAGLRAGDVITAIDGSPVDEVSEVREAVSDKKEGESMDLTILRDKREQKIAVQVEEAPDNYGAFFMPGNFNWDDLVIDIPPVPKVPKMKGLYRGYYDDDESFDAGQFRQEMDKLRDEMKRLQEELQHLQKDFGDPNKN